MWIVSSLMAMAFVLLTRGGNADSSAFVIQSVTSSLPVYYPGHVTVEVVVPLSQSALEVLGSWSKEVTRDDRRYWVPISAENDVTAEQTEWHVPYEERHVTNTLNYASVPDVTNLTILYTLRTIDGAVSYSLTLTLPTVKNSHYASDVIDCLNMTYMNVIERPMAMQHYTNEVNEEYVMLHYSVIHGVDLSPTVTIIKYTVPSEPSGEYYYEMFQEEILFDSSRQECNMAAGTTNSKLISLNMTHRRTFETASFVSDLQISFASGRHISDYRGRYVVVWETAVEKLSLTFELLGSENEAVRSIAALGVLNAQITGCNRAAQRKTDFWLLANVEDCVLCSAVGNPTPLVEMYDANGYPVGSGLAQTVYYYHPYRDVTVVVFILVEPFAASYSCKVTNGLGKEVNIGFRIDIVQ